MNAKQKSMTESFFEYFDICYAGNQIQRDHVGRIRYRVYCEEFGYEPGESFPDGIERDDFDQQSLHCLVTHKTTDTPAGCVRAVLTRGDDPLPFEKFCSNSLDAEFFEHNPMPRESICEISRLAVDGFFRRRAGEKATRYGGGVNIADLSKREQRTFPLIAIACYLGAIAAGAGAGCTRAFAMMEPFLPRLLQHSGIKAAKVGQEIDYHGLRAPYYMTLEENMDSMIPELREFYDEIERFVAKGYQQSTNSQLPSD